jgi:hypothetical protein
MKYQEDCQCKFFSTLHVKLDLLCKPDLHYLQNESDLFYANNYHILAQYQNLT